MLYPELFGGIQAFTKDHYIQVNGYSNKYWGWGSEDDDLYKRVVASDLKVKRPPMDIARFKMNQENHFRNVGFDLWMTKNKHILEMKPLDKDIDGLNTISKIDSHITIEEKPLYTHISIILHPKLKKGKKFHK